MKHELEDQLKAFEKKGIDRRHFFKLQVPKRQKHFQAKPKVKL